MNIRIFFAFSVVGIFLLCEEAFSAGVDSIFGVGRFRSFLLETASSQALWIEGSAVLRPSLEKGIPGLSETKIVASQKAFQKAFSEKIFPRRRRAESSPKGTDLATMQNSKNRRKNTILSSTLNLDIRHLFKCGAANKSKAANKSCFSDDRKLRLEKGERNLHGKVGKPLPKQVGYPCDEEKFPLHLLLRAAKLPKGAFAKSPPPIHNGKTIVVRVSKNTFPCLPPRSLADAYGKGAFPACPSFTHEKVPFFPFDLRKSRRPSTVSLLERQRLEIFLAFFSKKSFQIEPT